MIGRILFSVMTEKEEEVIFVITDSVTMSNVSNCI